MEVEVTPAAHPECEVQTGLIVRESVNEMLMQTVSNSWYIQCVCVCGWIVPTSPS